MLRMLRWNLIVAASVLVGGVSAEAATPRIKDHGRLFTPPALKDGGEQLQEIKYLYQRDLIVETYPSIPLRKDPFRKFKDMNEQARTAFFRKWARDQAPLDSIYVLINKGPSLLDVQVEQGRAAPAGFSRKDCEELQALVLSSLGDDDNDAALAEAIRFVRYRLDTNLGGPLAPRTFDWAGVNTLILVLAASWLVLEFLQWLIGGDRSTIYAGISPLGYGIGSNVVGGLLALRAARPVSAVILRSSESARDVDSQEDAGPNWVGAELADGRYQVTARLGAGGMGVVYRARDRNLDTDVVIKVPRASLLADPQFAGRFDREIRSLVNLVHPRIVRILDVGEHQGVPFVVMQYLSGGSLRAQLEPGTAGRTLVLRPLDRHGWIDEIAGALDFIHARGYIHRDVKPDNILFDAEGHAYLSDFGVAKALADSRSADQQTNLTGTGAVVGTPRYLAPELLFEKPYDGRLDQYSLAVTVYEVLSGRPPFDGPSAVVAALHMTQAPPLLHELRPAIPPALSAVVHRALAKDPQARYPSCAAFAHAALEALSEATDMILPAAPPPTYVAERPTETAPENVSGREKEALPADAKNCAAVTKDASR